VPRADAMALDANTGPMLRSGVAPGDLDQSGGRQLRSVRTVSVSASVAVGGLNRVARRSGSLATNRVGVRQTWRHFRLPTCRAASPLGSPPSLRDGSRWGGTPPPRTRPVGGRVISRSPPPPCAPPNPLSPFPPKGVAG